MGLDTREIHRIILLAVPKAIRVFSTNVMPITDIIVIIKSITDILITKSITDMVVAESITHITDST